MAQSPHLVLRTWRSGTSLLRHRRHESSPLFPARSSPRRQGQIPQFHFACVSQTRKFPGHATVGSSSHCFSEVGTLTMFTAFILFRQHYQASVVAQNPGLANPEISKIIGEQWRALPNDIKEQWKALAEVLLVHERHKRQELISHPGRKSPTSTAIPGLPVPAPESRPRWLSTSWERCRLQWQSERIIHLQPLRWTSDEPSIDT